MNKLLKICLWALAFFPLVVDNVPFVASNNTENIFIRTILCAVSIIFVINLFNDKKFLGELIAKAKYLIINPIVISVISFFSLYIISSIFATDKYLAFFGNIDRAEGLAGITYLLCFFIFSLFLFEKEDWLWFFRLSLITSLILFFSEFIQHGSLVGNTTFLSGYLLFSIFASIIVFSRAKEKFWKYLSAVIFPLSILGIFFAQTRGTILGIVVGCISVLIYLFFRGKNLSILNINLKKLSIVLLCIFVALSVIFFVTRKSEVWQKIPGVARVADISNTDSTTQTRLLMTNLGLKAVNPVENGLKKFLIGWGPENFSLAYIKYFNTQQYDYEVGWFDRSHNEFLDRLVMEGFFGFIAYLSIWFFFFRSVVNKKTIEEDSQHFPFTTIALIFFGSALFVHLAVVFQQITTFVPFFAVLTFIVCLTIVDKKVEYQASKSENIFLASFFIILMLFLSFLFLRNDLPAYVQMRNYGNLRVTSDSKIMLENLDSSFDPFTTAQEKIRYDFLAFISSNYDLKNPDSVKLYDMAIKRGEEYIVKMPNDLQFVNLMALTYTTQGKNLNDLSLLKKGEEYLNNILLQSPEKPDFNYGLALNWLYQKKYDDSFSLFEKIFNTSPNYFNQKYKGPEGIYTLFLKHFYETRDLNNFIKTAQRLKSNDYVNSTTLDKIIKIIQDNNIWPNINFN